MFATKPYIRGIGLMIFIVVLLIIGCQSIDRRCRRPVIKNCNASEEYIDGWKFTGWYYHTTMRACRPLYTPNGWHTCTENYELPEAREMCEDLCAEPCMKTNRARGICMSNEICRVSYPQRPVTLNQCRSNKLNCCPKVTDKELLPTPGPAHTNVGGIVQVLLRRNLSDPGYPNEAFDYIYYFPYYVDGNGKRYN